MNPWQEYNRRKHEWLAANPDHTPQQLEQACQRIAKELGL